MVVQNTINDLTEHTSTVPGAALLYAAVAGADRRVQAKYLPYVPGYAIDPRNHGGYFDGSSHLASADYGSLGALQAVHPHARSLDDEMDGIALQAAFNAVPAVDGSGQGGGTVVIPGHGRASYPVFVTMPRTRVHGDLIAQLMAVGRGGGGASSSGGFPLLSVFDGDDPQPVTETSLATGSGAALTLDGTTEMLFHLGDMQGWFRATQTGFGLAAFTLECFFRVDTAATGAILRSVGGMGSGLDYTSSAISIMVLSDRSIKFEGRVGSGSFSQTSSAGVVTLGTIYHCAISYDGSTVRCYMGQKGASTAVFLSEAETGNFQPDFTEDLYVGSCPTDHQFPASFASVEAIDGAVDSILFDETAKYTTSSITHPSAKFSKNSTTQLLVNFDDVNERFVKVESEYGDGWAFYRYGGGGAGVGSCVFANLRLTSYLGIGLLLNNSQNTHVEHIWCHGSPRIGVDIENNCYACEFEDLDVNAAKIGVKIANNCSVSKYGRMRVVATGGIGVAAKDIRGSTLDDIYCSGSKWTLLVNGIDMACTVRGVSYGDENTETLTRGGILIGGECRSVYLSGLASWFHADKPALTVADGAGKVVIDTPEFKNNNAGNKPVKVLGTPGADVVIRDPVLQLASDPYDYEPAVADLTAETTLVKITNGSA